ncbi:SusC/RagA family TonB-linked outer membrane protein [Spirosoma migulaei]
MKKPWESPFSLYHVMKITCVQLILAVVFTSLTIARNGMAQELLNRTVSVQVENKPLKTVLNRIEKAAKIKFTYVPQLIDAENKVSVWAANDRLDVILDRLLKPLNISYQVSGNYIVLRKEASSSSLPDMGQIPIMVAELTIAGTVSDEKGDVLPGVSVLLKGTQRGTVTDSKGEFRLAVPNNSAVLVFSFVGYQSQEVAVGNQTTLTIQLKADEKALNEVVVIGYGAVRKRDLTGSVASIGSTELTAQPISSFNQALQGRVAGVQVTNSSNAPGGGVTIRVRGGNSISASNDPLYVIDGFPVTNPASAQGASGSSNFPNVLSTINPNDIESIEVLKDASATAIYGSRGANGVVLVTTRRGKEGRSTVNFDAYYGVSNITKMLELATAEEQTALKNEQLRNLGFAERFGYTTAYPKKPSEYGVGTNWQKEIYRQAPMQNYQLSFSGGTDKLRYLISGNYFNQDGIIITNNYKRYTGRINLDATVSNRFKIGTTFTVSHGINNGINETGYTGSPVGAARTISPASPVYDATGNWQLLNVGPGSGMASIANPVALLRTSTNALFSDRVLGNLFGEYTLLAGLTARVSVGVDLLNTRRYVFYTPQTLAANTVNGYGSNGTSSNVNLLNENTLTYNRTLNANHAFDVVAGITFQSNREDRSYQEAQNFANYTLGAYSLGQGSVLLAPTTTVQKWGLNSYLGRINYRFMDRYLFTLTGRLDGSSRFGLNNKYGFFPSGAFAWRVSDEPFLKNSKAISDLKFRLSYGLTGNDGIGLYSSLPSYVTSRSVFGDTEVVTTQAQTIGNPDLRWEKTGQFDAGFDLGLLNNRIQVTADYYIKTTTDLLLGIDLPATTGFTTVIRNIGSLTNKGVELGITSVNVDGKFKWTTSGNISANRNKVTRLADADQYLVTDGGTSMQTIVKVGEPIGSFYGRVFDGVWQSTDAVKAAGSLAQTGDIGGAPRFKDVNGDGVFNNATDRAIIGNGLPKFIYGLTNTVSFKGLDLSIFFQGVQGNQIFNYTRSVTEIDPGATALQSFIDDHWQTEKPSNNRPSARQWNFTNSSYLIENGSFLRLKNVSLGYRLPLKTKAIRSARVYVSGQNLLTFTKYTGYDPEVNSNFTSNTTYGIDNYAYPPSRTFTIGGTITF